MSIIVLQITSLKSFTDKSYDSLLRFYADDNQIASMLELEGTKFLEKFETLYLRRNKIKSVSNLENKFFVCVKRLTQNETQFQIPIYLLSNTLDRSPDGRVLCLEGNNLYCDCNSAKVLKVSFLNSTW